MLASVPPSALIGKDQSGSSLVPCEGPPPGAPSAKPGAWLAYLLSARRLDGAQGMAFGRQCLHYENRGGKIFNWCLVPRLDWIYRNGDDADPHWLERGPKTDLVGHVKLIEIPTAVVSARDLYNLQASPYGRISAKPPQSTKLFSAAAMCDLGGARYEEIAHQLAYSDERAARRAAAQGRQRWSRLGAWPWAHWDEGRPCHDQWWTETRELRTLQLWLADAERVASADRERQARWYRLAARADEKTATGYRQVFKDVAPPPKYNPRIHSATSEPIRGYASPESALPHSDPRSRPSK
jgi:hypothetical protein